ncbi:hypothetical protein [Corynebacterium sp. HMSC077D03]|uniref:hypothetical protein n=1 Tax=Corynebacterium sp. HMSC077D03 TaxID=1739392 RepID=UPI0008A3D8E1|nr:hypothetical protein [Corynebacterium sp. HMSC077D03]OFR40813.1 hypothetical protein HMPREF2888_04860 [Corynebacterium sp. HMSC077D03]
MTILILEVFLALPVLVAVFAMSRSATWTVKVGWGAVAGLFIVLMLLAWAVLRLQYFSGFDALCQSRLRGAGGLVCGVVPSSIGEGA